MHSYRAEITCDMCGKKFLFSGASLQILQSAITVSKTLGTFVNLFSENKSKDYCKKCNPNRQKYEKYK